MRAEQGERIARGAMGKRPQRIGRQLKLGFAVLDLHSY